MPLAWELLVRTCQKAWTPVWFLRNTVFPGPRQTAESETVWEVVQSFLSAYRPCPHSAGPRPVAQSPGGECTALPCGQQFGQETCFGQWNVSGGKKVPVPEERSKRHWSSLQPARSPFLLPRKQHIAERGWPFSPNSRIKKIHGAHLQLMYNVSKERNKMKQNP